MPSAVTGTATGRLEVLGNHTDYNQGLVLAMGVGFTLDVRGQKGKDGLGRFNAAFFDGHVESIRMDDLRVSDPETRRRWVSVE